MKVNQPWRVAMEQWKRWLDKKWFTASQDESSFLNVTVGCTHLLHQDTNACNSCTWIDKEDTEIVSFCFCFHVLFCFYLQVRFHDTADIEVSAATLLKCHDDVTGGDYEAEDEIGNLTNAQFSSFPKICTKNIKKKTQQRPQRRKRNKKNYRILP